MGIFYIISFILLLESLKTAIFRGGELRLERLKEAEFSAIAIEFKYGTILSFIAERNGRKTEPGNFRKSIFTKSCGQRFPEIKAR